MPCKRGLFCTDYEAFAAAERLAALPNDIINIVRNKVHGHRWLVSKADCHALDEDALCCFDSASPDAGWTTISMPAWERLSGITVVDNGPVLLFGRSQQHYHLLEPCRDFHCLTERQSGGRMPEALGLYSVGGAFFSFADEWHEILQRFGARPAHLDCAKNESPRHCAATFNPCDSIVIAGGYTGTRVSCGVIAYDPGADRWSRLPSMLLPRHHARGHGGSGRTHAILCRWIFRR